MQFDELDAKMRVFETAHDHCVLPGINIVVRLDGRSFTRLTKETLTMLGPLGVPFDHRWHQLMTKTIEHLMSAVGFQLQHHAVFDARVCQLPTEQLVVDYFRWRQEDAARNALFSHCYYQLVSTGLTPEKAHDALRGATTSVKNELLFSHGTNFNDLPLWQRHGSGMYAVDETKIGFNPKLQIEVETIRRRLKLDSELPRGDTYGEFVRKLYRETLDSPSSSSVK